MQEFHQLKIYVDNWDNYLLEYLNIFEILLFRVLTDRQWNRPFDKLVIKTLLGMSKYKKKKKNLLVDGSLEVGNSVVAGEKECKSERDDDDISHDK